MVSHKKSRRRGSARQKRRSLTRKNVKSRKVMRGGKRTNGVIENDLYTYTGQYNRRRRPDGEGHMIFKTINYEYTGTFKNGTISGKGKMRLPDGKTFYGNWKNNKPIGIGVIKWNTGEETEGVYPDPEDDAVSEASTTGVPDSDDDDFVPDV